MIRPMIDKLARRKIDILVEVGPLVRCNEQDD